MGSDYLYILGIAQKGNMLKLGEECAAAEASRGRVRAVIIASDAAPGTKSRAEDISEAAGAPLLPVAETKAELGDALGKRPCAVIAVTDAGIAAAIAKKLARENSAAAAALSDMESIAARIIKRRGKKRGKRAR